MKSLWAQALRILVFAAVVLAAGTLFHPSFAGAGETIFNPQPYGQIFALRLSDGFTVRLTHNKWEDGVPSCGILP